MREPRKQEKTSSRKSSSTAKLSKPSKPRMIQPKLLQLFKPLGEPWGQKRSIASPQHQSLYKGAAEQEEATVILFPKAAEVSLEKVNSDEDWHPESSESGPKTPSNLDENRNA